MSHLVRLLTAAVVAVATAATGVAALGSSAQAVTGPTVAVHGHLVVVPSDRPGGRTAYAVALSDGDLVPVRGSFAPGVRTGATFDGRLRLPTGVVRTLVSRDESGGAAALRIVDRRSLSLRVAGTPTVTEATTADSVTPTVHTQYVAALDNEGTLGQTDAQLLTHVSNVGSYWTTQADNRISVNVPGTVKHYSTTTGTTACGLGSGQAGVNDFFALVQEAAGKFPGINWSTGTDQLVLFVPPSCSSGSTVGRGTVGSSFASGGALIAESSNSIEGVYAHETGHNYGLQHANARYAGTSYEYYGIYDVMGYAIDGYDQLTALSTPFRVFEGITDVGEIQDVDLGDGLSPVHVTATIAPRSDTTGLRSVRVTDPDTGEALYLDYRSGTGEDAGSAYAANVGLVAPTGTVPGGVFSYSPGVTLDAARAGGGNDALVLDSAGHTSLHAGSSWSDASGVLSISVTALTGTGADVSVDYTPPQEFSTVGTPVIGGDVEVGGTVTLDTGTWTPTPTTTQVRWTADGQAVPSLDDKTSFTAGPSLVGKQLVAAVTEGKAGYRTTTAQSAGATVQPGTIHTSANPTVSGTPKVGFTLHASTGSWSPALSTVTASYQWQRDGADIAGANSADYQVTPDDVGSAIDVTQTLTAPGYQTVVLTSTATTTVPEPVIDPAPTPVVTGTPRVGSPLTVVPGTWMTGVALAYQWYVDGSPVSGATGTSYSPRAGDLGRTVHVEVTGTRADYPTVTVTSAESTAVAPGILTAPKPVISGKPRVGKTLTAEPGRWTRGTTLRYLWLADGTVIKHQTSSTLTLTRAQKGKRITVKVTGSKPGYATVSRTSARTARVR
jgi:hypothetical protein